MERRQNVGRRIRPERSRRELPQGRRLRVLDNPARAVDRGTFMDPPNAALYLTAQETQRSALQICAQVESRLAMAGRVGSAESILHAYLTAIFIQPVEMR
jgi:hypothetical protein